MDNNRFLDNLAKQAEENPVVALGVAAALITAFSKLLSATTDKKNSAAWAKEVARRAAKDARKS